ncbi:MAG: radical SAM protein, partial [Bacteroidota bacterium]
MENPYLKGRGAQHSLPNKFEQQHVEYDDFVTGENAEQGVRTQLLHQEAKQIVNKVDSPDLGFEYSLNPYQGCEHGCIYCYARNSHEYWGFNSGIDFESKIVIKSNAPELLEDYLLKLKEEVRPIVLSGNTDCYQPIERKFGITRKLLEVFAKYRYPVSIITKNSLVVRDLDLLQDLASDNLVHVMV